MTDKRRKVRFVLGGYNGEDEDEKEFSGLSIFAASLTAFAALKYDEADVQVIITFPRRVPDSFREKWDELGDASEGEGEWLSKL